MSIVNLKLDICSNPYKYKEVHTILCGQIQLAMSNKFASKYEPLTEIKAKLF